MGMLILLSAVLAGCGVKPPPADRLDIFVVNEGVAPIRDIRVGHNHVSTGWEVLEPGKTTRRYRVDTDIQLPVFLEFRMENDEQLRRAEYRLHTIEGVGGFMQFRIDRDGVVTPVSRYHIGR